MLPENHFKKYQSLYLWAGSIISLTALIIFYSPNWFYHNHRFGFYFDQVDLKVYFNESRWVKGDGILYRDVFSEYLLLPNLVFGLVRFFTPNHFQDFAFGWISLCLSILLFFTVFCFKKVSKSAIIFWLTPATLFFATFRFDIYPAAFCFLGLYFLKKHSLRLGAFWLGVTIAFKGYFLFSFPTLFLWFLSKDRKNAITLCALTLGPFLITSLIVIAFAGLDGFLSPFLFHLKRGTNGESIYDLISIALNLPVANMASLSKFFQIFFALLPLPFIYKKDDFDSLIDALAISVLGFITFSNFYSPQFCLWIIPFLCFRQNWIRNTLGIVFLTLTFFYFPVTYLEKHRPDMNPAYLASLSIVVLSRLGLIFESVYCLYRRRRKN